MLGFFRNLNRTRNRLLIYFQILVACMYDRNAHKINHYYSFVNFVLFESLTGVVIKYFGINS